MQKTRIICTIGPATESYEMLQKLYEAGMSIARLNMSHGDHESHAKVIQHIKTLNRKVKFPIPILLDTQGPEIRTGDLSNELDLRQGDIVSVTTRGPMDVEESSIQINYADLLDAVDVGDRITVDNGLINFEVLEKHERHMRCRVLDGGLLKSKRHVNLPGVGLISRRSHIRTPRISYSGWNGMWTSLPSHSCARPRISSNSRP